MPTVKEMLICKREPTLENWLPFLEARMLFVRGLLDSITLAPLAATKLSYGGEETSLSFDLRQEPDVKVSLPIPRGHIGRPLGLQGLWHWTGDFSHQATTDIWGLPRGHYEHPAWARLLVSFARPFRVVKIWLAACTFRDLCRELNREPDYFWTTMGEDISRVVETRQGLADQARGWESEMFGDDELLIAAGLLKPGEWGDAQAMRRLIRH